MSHDKLPTPLIPVAFSEAYALPLCLRAALHAAKRTGCGMTFEYGGQDYTVQPWQSVDQVLEQADMALAASVREHLSHG